MPFASPPSPNETAYPDRRSPTQHFDEPSRSLLRSGCAREALGRQRHFRSLCRARVSRSRHMPLRCSMECRSARARDETLAPTRSAHHPARKVCGERRTSRMNIPETQSLPRSHHARAWQHAGRAHPEPSRPLHHGIYNRLARHLAQPGKSVSQRARARWPRGESRGTTGVLLPPPLPRTLLPVSH